MAELEYRMRQVVFCPECCNVVKPFIEQVNSQKVGDAVIVTLSVKCDCGHHFKVYNKDEEDTAKDWL
jgi:hypothetical protein